VTWSHLVIAAAGLASMKAAFERGDLDEAARQGTLAGPVIIEQALVSPDRATRLAAIAAAPTAEDRAELLDALATAAGGPDRRTAIPAARAARAIALELSHKELADDLAPDDLAGWRTQWSALALDRTRWIEVRVLALDTAAALGPLTSAAGPAGGSATTTVIATALADPDPALRRAAIADLPVPVPADQRAAIAQLVVSDTDSTVAIAAAHVLCADLVADPAGPVLDALGEPGLARLKAVARSADASRGEREAIARCLAAARKR
jgi:hypothetical protein